MNETFHRALQLGVIYKSKNMKKDLRNRFLQQYMLNEHNKHRTTHCLLLL